MYVAVCVCVCVCMNNDNLITGCGFTHSLHSRSTMPYMVIWRNVSNDLHTQWCRLLTTVGFALMFQINEAHHDIVEGRCSL